MKCFILIIVILTFSALVFGSERLDFKNVVLDQLTDELQPVIESGSDHIALVWWIPVEYWYTTYEQEEHMSEVEKEEMYELLNDYSLLMVWQADISTFGSFRHYSLEEIEENLNILYKDGIGNTKELSILKDYESDLKIMISIFKPIFSEAAGNLGDNLHFFVLSDKDVRLGRVIDPYYTGEFVAKLKTRTGQELQATIESPLNSLFKPRFCPNGKPAHVSWQYCPWTGTKLED